MNPFAWFRRWRIRHLERRLVELIHANGLGFCEGAAIKYISRHKRKGGAEDLRKAIHFLQLLIELEYPEMPEPTLEKVIIQQVNTANIIP